MLASLYVMSGLMSYSLAAICLSSTKFTATSMQTMATLNIGATTPEIYDMTNIMDYDADRKMIAVKSYRFENGTYTNFTSVQDFNIGWQYVTGNSPVRFCNEERLYLPFFGPCLPDNVTVASTYTAAGGVTVHVYAMEMSGSQYYIHITDTGEPFAYVTYGSNTVMQQMDSQIFGNVKMGVLSDPHVFNNPGCHGQGSGVVGK